MISLQRLSCLAAVLAALALAAPSQAQAGFKSVSVEFIAALAEPDATSGTGAETWGLWRIDPGPRGVELRDYDKLLAAGGVAPARVHPRN